ncbi:Rz1-like lysis system protein LysC [Mixta intestinalis]|uniref:Rz1-like lysis system protein LysC n=1 Tax=Mixta intestinalis TaxID=1615494 RepID=UPI001FCC2F21|nr:Rz1-like lysis system protein LysC [Mixta intestinalis]
MQVQHYAAGVVLLCLMMLSGCTRVPPSATPVLIWTGCPRVTSCPVPGNHLKTQGDLAADNRQLEAALVSCGLQIEMIKECQEQHDVKAEIAARSAD